MSDKAYHSSLKCMHCYNGGRRKQGGNSLYKLPSLKHGNTSFKGMMIFPTFDKRCNESVERNSRIIQPVLRSGKSILRTKSMSAVDHFLGDFILNVSFHRLSCAAL